MRVFICSGRETDATFSDVGSSWEVPRVSRTWCGDSLIFFWVAACFKFLFSRASRINLPINIEISLLASKKACFLSRYFLKTVKISHVVTLSVLCLAAKIKRPRKAMKDAFNSYHVPKENFMVVIKPARVKQIFALALCDAPRGPDCDSNRVSGDTDRYAAPIDRLYIIVCLESSVHPSEISTYSSSLQYHYSIKTGAVLQS